MLVWPRDDCTFSKMADVCHSLRHPSFPLSFTVVCIIMMKRRLVFSFPDTITYQTFGVAIYLTCFFARINKHFTWLLFHMLADCLGN